jgi:hypothetical protein
MLRSVALGTSIVIITWLATDDSVAGAEIALAAPPAVRDVGNRKQLFMDHRFVEREENLRHVVNPPEQHVPVLPGEGFETEYINGYSTIIQQRADAPLRLYASVLEDYAPVIRDWLAGKLQRWPERARGETPKIRDVTLRLYESDDGLHFRRPRLGVVEHHGSKDNNVVLTGRVEATPFFDTNPKCPAEERWKLITSENTPIMLDDPRRPGKQGLALWVSPDGLRWTCKPKMLTNDSVETPIPAWWDDRIGKYVAYQRRGGTSRIVDRIDEAIRVYTGSRDVLVRPSVPSRATSRIEVDDISAPWPQPPDFVFSTDSLDPPNSDFYQTCACKYPWAEDVYLAFPPLYRHTPPPIGLDGNDGPLCTQFACSRDGIFWMRPERKPYLRPGLSTEGSRSFNFMLLGMARYGNWIYQYYRIAGATHHGTLNTLPREELRRLLAGNIICAKQRLDGFVSLDAAYTGGWITTPPIRFEGSRLELNLDTEAAGTALVELREASGKPIPSHTLADCDEIGGNYLAKTVTWHGKSDVSKLAVKPVRLHVRVRATKLYGFQFR